MWGLFPTETLESYGQNVAAVGEVLPELLGLLSTHDVQVTFATVGSLFFDDAADWQRHLPPELPMYEDNRLSPYQFYRRQKAAVDAHPNHFFAPHLIERIRSHREHEIATHTFSHYCCLEAGQTHESFRCDLKHAMKVARRFDIELKSIIFPRNQYSYQHVRICQELGLIAFRGNESSWMYAPRAQTWETRFQRACRLADSYLNLSGKHCFEPTVVDPGIVNIPSSRFLRPHRTSLARFESPRLSRIQDGMRYAAERGLTYHLWWHPHNFGRNRAQNLAFLDEILVYFAGLRRRFGFESRTMASLAQEKLREHEHSRN